jgi:4'-phosphopantetheinyl transferase
VTCFWEDPPAESVPISLEPDKVDVWRASLTQTAARRQNLAQSLNPDEVARAGRFRFDRHRDAFIVARGFLRSVLARYLQVTPAAVAFVYGEKGKPALAAPTPLHFNLSHAGEMALLAVTYGREAGIDIEQIRPLDDAAQIAARFFAPNEYATWQTVPAEQQSVAFFNCWTRKEAFIKALGDGLSYPLDGFEVSLLPGEKAQLRRVTADPTAVDRWSMMAIEAGDGYAAAVVVAGHGWQLSCRQWL